MFFVCLCISLQERLLSRQGQQGSNRLFNLLQDELATRPGDAHVNVKLVQLFSQEGRLDEAVKHCLTAEKRGLLSHSLDWYTVVVHTLQVSTEEQQLYTIAYFVTDALVYERIAQQLNKLLNNTKMASHFSGISGSAQRIKQ